VGAREILFNYVTRKIVSNLSVIELCSSNIRTRDMKRESVKYIYIYIYIYI
jgi:hypothetical protein